MKTLKRLAAMMLSVCLLVPVIAFTSHAADGQIWFSDPTTSVGENVEVDIEIRGNGQPIGDTDIVLKYDETALELVDGGADMQKEGTGTLHYTGKGTGTEIQLSTKLVFRALQAGSAKITVESSSGYLFSDEGLYFQEGNSTVTINPAADGTTSVPASQTTPVSGDGGPVTVGSQSYTFAEDFMPISIPEGFAETMLTYNGAERKFVANASGVTLGYLRNAAGEGAFFLYRPEDATFSPYIVIEISDTASIALLDEADAVTLPEQYKEAKLTVSDYEMTAWMDSEHSEYYLIYAMNVATGEKQLYRYDTAEQTYQRYVEPQTDEPATDAADTESKGKGMLPFLLGGGAVLLIMLIVIIVLAVKLLHRNQELDDIYEEYGILDEEPEPEAPKKKDKKAGKPSGKTKRQSEESFDEYEDEDEYDDYEEEPDEYEDEYDEYDDEYEDDFAEYDEDEYDDEDEYEDDDEYAEFDEAFEEEPVRVSSKGKKNTGSAKGKKAPASAKGKKGYDLEFIDL